MNKLNYGNFNSSNTDIAFSATKGYSDPTSEELTRKQLSYPLKEVKTFVNKTVSVKQASGSDIEGSPVQLVLTTDENLQYRDDDGILHDVKVGESAMKSFVGMVVMGTNLTSESALQNIYGSTTNWTNLSSVIVASEHVFGNGKALGLTIGTDGGNVSLRAVGTGLSPGDRYGENAGTTQGNQKSTTGTLGVPTKTQAGANPENTGLIVETKTVYTWERTA